MGRSDSETETLIPVAHSLRADGFDASEDGTGRGTPLVPISFSISPGSADKGTKDEAYLTIIDTPLDTDGHTMAVAFTVSEMSGGFAWERDVAPALQAHPQSETSNRQSGVRQGMQVRRLTPLECERLMGMPDNYTDVPYKGKRAADGPRYRALGNSFAVNCIRWVGERIAAHEGAA